VSFEAVRWALAQSVGKSAPKFVLVAMAEHVNAESQEWTCWPSYAALCTITHQNSKTVEAAVYRLKELGLIVDTGERKGATGKVVVFRLNTTKSGCVTPGPLLESAHGTRPENTTAFGGVKPGGNPPKFQSNPPKFDGQSPQISGAIHPKTGVRSRNGTSNGTRNEPGIEALEIAGVPPKLLADWKAVRKDKRAGPITDTVIEATVREAGKAGLTVADAVRYCCEAGWQGFNAGFYAKRENKGPGSSPRKTSSRHSGFRETNYLEGVTDGIPDA
jgi:hypothetical protein